MDTVCCHILEAKGRHLNLSELQEEYDRFDEDVSLFGAPSGGEYIFFAFIFLQAPLGDTSNEHPQQMCVEK